MYRIPETGCWPARHVNRIVEGDAHNELQQLPDESIALAVTSPPYWNTIDYEVAGQIGQTSYQRYLEDLLAVWRETYRVLIPNGKLAVITPIMPIAKAVIGDQHTRHLKNISSDIEQTILADIPNLERFSLFIWQKQTSAKMFGSYPYPPNIYEDNTIEFINVFVKGGIPPGIPKEVKEPSKITQEEWRNLTMQVWPMYPEDVKRAGGHPCPFPLALPLRLIQMYTFKEDSQSGFVGDVVLDMFNGTGSTCVAARAAGRNWVGIDLNPRYCEVARERIKKEDVDPQQILLEHVRVKGARSSRQIDMFSADSLE
jgi:DNA modification methylase